MDVKTFAKEMNSKSLGRKDYHGEEHLEERIYTGMLKICSKTTPLSLIIENPTNEKIQRRIDENTWMRTPRKPDMAAGLDIDFDEGLMDALQYFVIAGLEPQRAKVMMGFFHTAVEEYDARLTEAYLAEASNDADRFHVFP